MNFLLLISAGQGNSINSLPVSVVPQADGGHDVSGTAKNWASDAYNLQKLFPIADGKAAFPYFLQFIG